MSELKLEEGMPCALGCGLPETYVTRDNLDDIARERNLSEDSVDAILGELDIVGGSESICLNSACDMSPLYRTEAPKLAEEHRKLEKRILRHRMESDVSHLARVLAQRLGVPAPLPPGTLLGPRCEVVAGGRIADEE